MIKILSLTLVAISLTAAPVFPDFAKDGYSIKGSSLIGTPITTPGRYLFALEDLRCPVCDYDFNDVYGEVNFFGLDFPYSFNVQGGLGAYFNAGTASFAGVRILDGVFTLVFNTPTGEMFSGTPQVLVYRLESFPTNSIPEPSTYALVGAALLALVAIRYKKGAL